MEVVKGWHKLSREERITQFISRWSNEKVLTISLKESVLAGRIYADLERTGQPIGYPDVMIAAIAIENHLKLVTGNTFHYQRIQGLKYPLVLDNWR